MAHQSDLIEKDILAYLKSQEEKSLLRFITCGSVDDGKSTLIGRLLWDSKMVFEDQLAALEVDSKKVGTQGGAIDYALLLDGLQAEREQGITIDVAYRFFSTDRRKFIVADTPGHEQYTRNMVTGASTAQVAVILVDARKGLLTQTRRHSYLVSLVGIRHVMLAINKMDLIDFDRERYESIVRDYEEFAAPLGFASITAIPISALNGDNIIEKSANTPWYHGPTLMNYLETVQVEDDAQEQPFRLPVQWVNRPHLDFRGFCGTIAAGTIRPGDEVRVASSGRTSRVARIVTMNGDLQQAVAGQAVTLTLTDEIDISRGDMLAAIDAPPRLSRHPEAHLVWMHDEPLQPGKVYLVKTASAVTPGRVTRVQFAVDVNSLEQKQVPTLGLNGIGVVRLELDRPVALDPYRQNRETGSFILIDRFTNATVAAGMVISVAPLESQKTQPTELDASSSDAGGLLPRRFILTEFSMSGTEPGVADLTAERGPIEFEVSESFIDYLGKGNRILFRLRDVGQLEPVARMAYEHNLNFEFGRDQDRVNVILYRDPQSAVALPAQVHGGGL
ncbi:sulfate adenylyltransferase subunit CysN [Geotalea uraniireducens]|uniref:Sulfate adenylyltransferase subunit 1 n=1 Tax=Geotalea uraniireducens (strain Rf4) TaxID=351605 RepID=A5G8G2_GEOUR|nr:sulfate adenylyltransferase subunit CysN [Geotalea uraniireducens]ABQ28080.1 sulfate adenylyltransferase subunit 1 [Geotalea uraniireducens Rf4]